MKFIHTSDFHVGSCRWIPDYLSRQEEMIDSIFDVAYSRNISTVVVAGDIFDDPDTLTQAEREMVKRKLFEYDSAGFRILMIPGNHDVVDATGYTAIHYLSMLGHHGKFRHSSVVETTSFVSVENTIFCLLCHRKHKFKEDSEQAVRQLVESSLDVPYRNLVVVAHETISGSQTDVTLKDGSQFVLESGAEAPSASLPVTYWALGDIHVQQRVGPRAFYCGSPIQTSFAGTWPKGILIVDTDNPDSPEFVALESNRLVKVKVGDAIPPNSYVKWVAPSLDEVPEDLPSNVLKVAVEEAPVSLDLDVDSSMRERVILGLRQQGLSDGDLVLATKELDSILSTISDEGSVDVF